MTNFLNNDFSSWWQLILHFMRLWLYRAKWILTSFKSVFCRQYHTYSSCSSEQGQNPVLSTHFFHCPPILLGRFLWFNPLFLAWDRLFPTSIEITQVHHPLFAPQCSIYVFSNYLAAALVLFGQTHPFPSSPSLCFLVLAAWFLMLLAILLCLRLMVIVCLTMIINH